jgi:hypothetical protein
MDRPSLLGRLAGGLRTQPTVRRRLSSAGSCWHTPPRDSLDACARVQDTMWDGIARDGPELWTQGMAGAALQWTENRSAQTTRNRKGSRS